MNNPLEMVPIARRTMTLFFIIDVSGSMYGEKIGAVNTAIREVLPEIKSISAENADAEIKIAVLSFSNGTQWLSNPVSAEGFIWNNVSAGGGTDMGCAYTELNSKLSRSAFMGETSGCYAPVLFLMSDGAPTDDYKAGLAKLQENKWYKAAIKVALAIGSDADTGVLAEFTGNSELVLTVHTPEMLKKVIRFVSVTSSKIGSKSSSVGVPVGNANSQSAGNEGKQAEFAEQIKDFQEENSQNLADVTDGF